VSTRARRRSWFLLPTVAVLSAIATAIALTLAAAALDDTSELAREGRAARIGLCALKQDLQRRIETSRAILRARVPGVPSEVLLNSIANQQQTITALSVITCDDTGGTP
jgi:hypothetical protein